ncbi:MULTISPECIES: phage tail protein [unclassified Paenibacillus]|uniref:phage tail protein n=1 Tax=unclassified Paenibacillus TaxID=185978 RepID=UPI002406EBDF|nr:MULTISPECIES: phage tail protein [unclassified Paenibacillus]MDF9845528.1 phage protein U [Paenibacillus sp. PastF-2]MDF9852102.1 phage protein U [Paenibacillus sp. PastM-2]MDF9858692.1 phage protein U [Paenibacillus sp. PastF-1]MDH6483939.1 phage protein U [Paenibacillus sp. PastH-2]MDH6511318.1 phage protein U [Paenibacillus sp. PastM-3]
MAMSKIGSLGTVVFVVSPEATRTFQDFSRNVASRYAKHEILGQKPKTQWLGPGLDTISFTMWLDARHGLNPRKELDRLIELERAGKALPLIVGKKGIGTGLWIITGLSQVWKRIDNSGNVLFATVNVSLEEYVK